MGCGLVIGPVDGVMARDESKMNYIYIESGRCSCPYVACFPSGMLFRGVPSLRMSARVVVVLLALLWLARHRLRRPMAGLSRCWTCWVMAVV